MPREFFKSLIPAFPPEWKITRLHVPAMLVVVTVFFMFYFLHTYVGAGWLSYTVSVAMLLGVFATALARLNTIAHEAFGFRWQYRRFAWLAIIATSVTLCITEFSNPPSWIMVLFRFGVLGVWMTTPMMPPWARFMTGKFRTVTVEVAENVQVDVIRTPASHDGALFDEKREVDTGQTRGRRKHETPEEEP